MSILDFTASATLLFNMAIVKQHKGRRYDVDNTPIL